MKVQELAGAYDEDEIRELMEQIIYEVRSSHLADDEIIDHNTEVRSCNMIQTLFENAIYDASSRNSLGVAESYTGLQWSEQTPTEPGWYFRKHIDPDGWEATEICKVRKNSDGTLLTASSEVEMEVEMIDYSLWAGPISEPVEEDDQKASSVAESCAARVPTAGPVREVCSECGRVSPVGFWVPNDTWEEVMSDDRQHAIMCVMCFTRLADQKFIRWDKEIKFFPVSKKSHREQIQSNYESPKGERDNSRSTEGAN